GRPRGGQGRPGVDRRGGEGDDRARAHAGPPPAPAGAGRPGPRRRRQGAARRDRRRGDAPLRPGRRRARRAARGRRAGRLQHRPGGAVQRARARRRAELRRAAGGGRRDRRRRRQRAHGALSARRGAGRRRGAPGSGPAGPRPALDAGTGARGGGLPDHRDAERGRHGRPRPAPVAGVTMEGVRVLIADDQEITRSGLKALLASAGTVEVVGEARDGAECVALADELQPDVVLMDLRMPVLNGIEATRRIHRAQPHVGILVLTVFADDTSVFPAIRAGARGYLLKDASRDELLLAVETVARGGAIFSPGIAQKVMAYLTASS